MKPWKLVRELVTRLFTTNPLFKALSVATAVVLWAWLQSEQIVEESAWVDVGYDLPDALVTAQNPARRLRVTVKGPQRYVKRVRRADLSIMVNLQDAVPGVQQVDFVDSDIQGLQLSGVDVVGLVPNSVQVDLEEKHSRAVRVAATLVGEPATGYRVSSIEVVPTQVVVEGPQSVVERLGRVSTAPVDVAGLDDTQTFEVPVTLKPKSLLLANDRPVEVRVSVEALTSERTFSEVPIVMRDRGWEADLEMVTVTLSGPVSSLQAVDLETIAIMARPRPDLPQAPILADQEGSAGVRLVVVHNGGPDVELVDIDPPSFTVRPVQSVTP